MRRNFVCTNCGDTFDIEELNVFDGEELCTACFEDETIVCEDCDTRVWLEDTVNVGRTICQACFDNDYTTCENCGRAVHVDDAYYLDDQDYAYCQRCYDEIALNKFIHDYSYKPDPIFYGNAERYLGVELEIDGAGQDESNAEKLLDIANNSEKRIYIKHDGSLDSGMEIVSHPMTLDYHLNKMPWLDIMEKAISLGYRSHKTKTCGLHIHVNRSSFGESHDKQEECISRVLFFVERFWQELLKFSRRTEGQLSRWAARYGIRDNPKATLDNAKKSYTGRYTCVNLTNSDTIEFRIFRGTLKYNTFVAALQLVNKICDISIKMTDEEIASLNWCDFVASVEDQELIRYLKERRLYVNDLIECEEEY